MEHIKYYKRSHLWVDKTHKQDVLYSYASLEERQLQRIDMRKVCFYLKARKGQVTPLPLGNEKKFLSGISKNIPSQEQQDFSPNGIVLICNQQFNAPRGQWYLKFKFEMYGAGEKIPTLGEVELFKEI